MTIFPFNIYEKSFTPYYASLAPKHLVNRHKLGRKPNKQSALWQSTKVKNFTKWVKKNIMSRPYLYLFGILLFSVGFEQTIRQTWIKIYRTYNYERSLAFAQEKEKAYLEERKRTHPEEFEEDEEEEAVEEEVVAEAEAEEDD